MTEKPVDVKIGLLLMNGGTLLESAGCSEYEVFACLNNLNFWEVYINLKACKSFILYNKKYKLLANAKRAAKKYFERSRHSYEYIEETMTEKPFMTIKRDTEKHRPPPLCAGDSNSFSCTQCDYCHDEGEDGGGLYCEYRDTHFVF